MEEKIYREPINNLIKDLLAWREAGYVKTMGKILNEAKMHPDAKSVSKDIEDHQSWFEWAVQYEQQHGVYSLVNEQHPIHLEVMRMVNSVKHVGLLEKAN